MPELPEVESIRLSLHTSLTGKTISSIKALVPKQLSGDHKKSLGKKISAVERRGKVVIISLSDETYISIHLKLTGQLLFAGDKNRAVFNTQIPLANTNTMPGKSTSVIIEFEDGSALFFNDLRKFGWVRLGPNKEGPVSADAVSSQFTEEYLKSATANSKKPIKVLLMDQEKIAGIGNIYANDSLFVAGINPERKANSLSAKEITDLYNAIRKILSEGIKYKGSSAKDEVYRLPDGTMGSYQNHFKVYQREGKPCLKCGEKILRIKQAGRSSFYCPNCQK